MPQDDRAGGEPLSPLRALARALLEFAGTRARLAAGELEEQALRGLEIALWSLAALFFLGTALVFASVLIVLLAWDANRLLAAGLLAGLYLSAAAVALLVVRRRLAERPKFLAATLAELDRDREHFSGGTGRAESREP